MAATAASAFSTPLATRVAARDERHARLTTELERRAFVFHGRLVDSHLPAVDHLAVAPSGVWLIRREHVHCAKVAVRRHLTGRTTLRIAGTDRTALLDTLELQLGVVRSLLFDHLDAPLHTALVLPGAEFPLLRSLHVGDHAILRPAQLLTELEARGPLKRARAREVAEALSGRLG